MSLKASDVEKEALESYCWMFSTRNIPRVSRDSSNIQEYWSYGNIVNNRSTKAFAVEMTRTGVTQPSSSIRITRFKIFQFLSTALLLSGFPSSWYSTPSCFTAPASVGWPLRGGSCSSSARAPLQGHFFKNQIWYIFPGLLNTKMRKRIHLLHISETIFQTSKFRRNKYFFAFL